MFKRSCLNLYQKFGHVTIQKSQIFYETNNIFACVNISPLLQGHILVCPKREVKRVRDLTEDELSDMMISAQKISIKLEDYLERTAVNFGIQDGKAAGQSVSHVHMHVIPRIEGDFKDKTEIYKKLRNDGKEVRELRSIDEMSEEADVFRKLMSS